MYPAERNSANFNNFCFSTIIAKCLTVWILNINSRDRLLRSILFAWRAATCAMEFHTLEKCIFFFVFLNRFRHSNVRDAPQSHEKMILISPHMRRGITWSLEIGATAGRWNSVRNAISWETMFEVIIPEWHSLPCTAGENGRTLLLGNEFLVLQWRSRFVSHKWPTFFSFSYAMSMNLLGFNISMFFSFSLCVCKEAVRVFILIWKRKHTRFSHLSHESFQPGGWFERYWEGLKDPVRGARA